MSLTGAWGVSVLYYFKMLYFVASSWQLRLGYPRGALHQLLTRQPALYHYFGQKMSPRFRLPAFPSLCQSEFASSLVSFCFLPFLVEVNALLGWLCTRTSMSIMDFYVFESVSTSLYKVRCARTMNRVRRRPPL